MAKRTGKRSPIGHYPMTRDPDTEVIYQEFARRLQKAMVAKGWSQSELARRANALLPQIAPGQKQGKDFRRDMVSHYIRGKHLPTPANLNALAEALEVRPGDLLPQGGLPNGTQSPFSMNMQADGRMTLHVNRTVSMDTAMKIAALLQAEDH